MECDMSNPNVVILKPDDNPNCNMNIHNTYDLYYNHIGIINIGYLDITYDKAIFSWLILYKENNTVEFLYSEVRGLT